MTRGLRHARRTRAGLLRGDQEIRRRRGGGPVHRAGRAGRRHRLSRPERRRQDHHTPDAAGSRAPRRRRRTHRRRALRAAAPPAADRRGCARGLQLPPGAQRREPSEGVRAGGVSSRLARGRGAGPGGTGGCRGPAHRRILPRHAPAPGTRLRAARRPRRARARRAFERSRPRGHQVDARVPASAGRRGPDGVRLVAPPRGGGSDRGRVADHLARAPGLPGGDRRSRRSD